MPPPPFRPERYRFGFSVKRRCWWAEGAAERRGWKVKWRERGGSRGQTEGERQQQKAELEVAACFSHSAWSSMTRLTCRATQIEPLPIFSGVWRSAPKFSLLRPKWSWSEKASGRGGGDGRGDWRFSSETGPISDALSVEWWMQTSSL